ncbi:MAG: 50S ribosomal protein L6 [Candidatus Eisenbacteria sp.]|nr:50S ribosomal protein L6 [Candidatus Eisenbacteria bacterium]
MSRVGKQPIPIPNGVKVSITGNRVEVSGEKGTLSREFQRCVTFRVENDQIVVSRNGESRTDRAFHGLSRGLLASMVEGVFQGFRRDLEVHGVGYRAEMKGDTLVLDVRKSHIINYKVPKGVKVETPDRTRIVVTGIDKQAVGQAAAEIRRFKPPEPYGGKGIRYMGEQVRRKAGKAGAATA